MTNEGMSPADYAAINGCNNGGMWGDGAWWIIILFLFAFNGNGWGNNNGGVNPYVASAVTQSDLQRGFDQNATMSKLDAISSGICNGFSTAELSRVNGNNNIMTQLNAMQMQAQECCCDNKAAIADLKYTIATENCADRAAISAGVRDIIDAQTASTRAILDKMCQNEIDNLKQRNADQLAEINALRFAQSQTAQNAFIGQALNAQTAVLNPTPIPAYIVQNPNCCSSNTGCGSCA